VTENTLPIERIDALIEQHEAIIEQSRQALIRLYIGRGIDNDVKGGAERSTRIGTTRRTECECT
jgi:hypothetical protein